MILSEQHLLIQNMARQFSRERLLPFAAEWDRDSIFPRQALQEMGALGFLGMTVPEAWGGAGADTLSLALALEEVAAGDAACATIMSGHNSVGCSPISLYGTEEQKERFLRPMAEGKMLSAFCLTEPQGGSDAGSLKTRAKRDGDHYVLNGTKQFITTGKNAEVALVFAATDPSAGSKGITAFIVPTDSKGYVVARVEKKMGQHASDTCQIIFEDLRIPASLRLGEEGQGYKIALGNLEGGRIGIASQAVGIARAALDAALAYAQERVTFGKRIIDHQAVGFRLASMATRVEAARMLVWRSAVMRDNQMPCLKEACMAKLVASEAAESVCSDAIQTLGGYGYLEDFPVERLSRDARVTKIYEGTNDIQHMIICREIQRG